jgi:hypothetical protein
MAFSPLAAMLGGAFDPDDQPLSLAQPGFNPNLPQMFGPQPFAPEGPTAPSLESYLPPPEEPIDPSSFITDAPQDASRYEDLLEPVRREPSTRARLMQAILPLLAAGVVGKLGGGMAGATGLLGGYNKATSDQQQLELEQAKLDAARRERALTRQQHLDQQRWERTVKQNAAVEAILKQAAEFDDPAAAAQWLQAIAPHYAKMGIDTTTMGSVVAPGMQRKIQKSAADLYTSIIDTQKKMLPEGEQLDVDGLHQTLRPTFRGKQMSLGELAEIAGYGVPSAGGRMESFKDEGKIEQFIRNKFQDFEDTTGRRPTREERNKIVLEAQRVWADAKVDPQQRALRQAQLQALIDKRNERTKTAGDWATKYSPQQQIAAGRFAARYTAASKQFATRSEAYDSIMSVASRPESPQAQMAIVFAFMKMLDPGSVVRETEYANAKNAAGVPERVRNIWNAVFEGRFLTKNQIMGMAREGAGLYVTHRKAHDRIVRQFAQAAMRQRIDPRDILTDFNASNDPMKIPGVADTPELEQNAEGDIAPVEAPSAAPAAPAAPPGAARRPTATQTKVPPLTKGAPMRPVPGQIVIYKGKQRKVQSVDAATGKVELYPE